MENNLKSILLLNQSSFGHLEWEGRLGKWNRETHTFEPGVTEEQFKCIFTSLANQKNDWTAIEPFSLEIDCLYKNGVRVRHVESGSIIVTKKRLVCQWTYTVTDDLAIRFALHEEQKLEEKKHLEEKKEENVVKLERNKKRCRFRMGTDYQRQWTYELSYVQQQSKTMSYEIEVEFANSLSLTNLQYAVQSLQYRMNAFVSFFIQPSSSSSSFSSYRLVSSFISTAELTTQKQQQLQQQQQQQRQRVWHICR